jgi:DNA repair protein RadD
VSAEDPAFRAGLGFCGAPFTFKEKLKRAASSEELVKNQMPVIEVFDVENVVYQKNVNRGDRSKPPTLKVTYYCGHKTFVEYVCLQHSDWAGRKAYKWWTIRSPLPLPASVDDALDVINQLAVPTQIRVHTNVKWPIVLACCYDGSRFGEREAQTTSVGVQIYTKNAILSNNVGEQQNLGPSYDDDEAYLPAHASAPMVNVVQSMNSSVQKDEEDFDDIPF